LTGRVRVETVVALAASGLASAGLTLTRQAVDTIGLLRVGLVATRAARLARALTRLIGRCPTGAVRTVDRSVESGVPTGHAVQADLRTGVRRVEAGQTQLAGGLATEDSRGTYTNKNERSTDQRADRQEERRDGWGWEEAKKEDRNISD
jgi:hypothetical protein